MPPVHPAATSTLGVRSPEPHWDAIGTAVIRMIRPHSIGVERILMQNRVGDLTPSVSVASNIATAMRPVPLGLSVSVLYATMLGLMRDA